MSLLYNTRRGPLVYTHQFSRYLGVPLTSACRTNMLDSVKLYGRHLSFKYPTIASMFTRYIMEDYERQSYHIKAYMYHKSDEILQNIHNPKLMRFMFETSSPTVSHIIHNKSFVDALQDIGVYDSHIWDYQKHLDPHVMRYIHTTQQFYNLPNEAMFELFGLMGASAPNVCIQKLIIPKGYKWSLETYDNQEMISIEKLHSKP